MAQVKHPIDKAFKRALMNTIEEYFTVQLGPVSGFMEHEITTKLAPPRLPPELWEKYQQKFIAIRAKDSDLEKTEYIELIAKEAARKFMESLLKI